MLDEGLTIKILGSGTSTGVPVVGCSCAVCHSTEVRNRRSRCSALVSWGGYNVLIDTSPDLRQQSLDHGIELVDAVLYTHHHADHVHGIDDLRVLNPHPDKPLPVYGSAQMVQHLTRCFSYVFEPRKLALFRPRLKAVVMSAPMLLFGRMVEPVPLLHGDERALGYRIGSMAYLTDCSALPQAACAGLRDLELLVIDGLRFRSHPTHFTVAQAIAVAGELQVKRVVLTHLSHDVDYAVHSEQLPDNVEFAYDGLTITLN